MNNELVEARQIGNLFKKIQADSTAKLFIRMTDYKIFYGV
jgi:hypothetical protein